MFTCTNIISQIFLQTGQLRSQGYLLPVGERTWERSCKQVIEIIKFNHDKYPRPRRQTFDDKYPHRGNTGQMPNKYPGGVWVLLEFAEP